MSQPEANPTPEPTPAPKHPAPPPLFVPMPIPMHMAMPPPPPAPRRGRDLAARAEVTSVKAYDYDGAEARRLRRRSSQVKKEAKVRKFMTLFAGVAVITACAFITWQTLTHGNATTHDGQVVETKDTEKTDIFSLFVD